jgi:hypothetical protein
VTEKHPRGRFAHMPDDPEPLAPRAARWLAELTRLTAWLGEHDAYPSENSDAAEEVRLARWVRRQRAARDRLSSWMQQQLRDLPGWSWDPRADRFFEGWILAREVVDRTGHLPRRTATDPAERAAGYFLYRVRRRTDLTDDQTAKLTELYAAAKFAPRSSRS